MQSASIIRYLAKKHGFNGSNEQEALEIDILKEGVDDMMMEFARAKWFNTDESKREEDVKKFLEEGLPKRLAQFQRALEGNHGGNGNFLFSPTFPLVLISLFLFRLLRWRQDILHGFGLRCRCEGAASAFRSSQGPREATCLLGWAGYQSDRASRHQEVLRL